MFQSLLRIFALNQFSRISSACYLLKLIGINLHSFSPYLLPSATKLRRLSLHRRVSVHRGGVWSGGCLLPGGVFAPGGSGPRGGVCSGGVGIPACTEASLARR